MSIASTAQAVLTNYQPIEGDPVRNLSILLPITVILNCMIMNASPLSAEQPAPQTLASQIEVPEVTYFQTSLEHGVKDTGYGELIFVDVVLNGETVPFVLDTGAPTVILNSAHFTRAMGESEAAEAYGVSGRVEMRSIQIESFDWNGIQLGETSLIGGDLAHLEEVTGSRLVGLIGFDMVKDFELFIDYEAKKLTLFRPDAANFHRDVKPTAEIRFELQAHIPVVDVEIGGKVMRFGIDTGASVNLLGEASFKMLEETTDYVARESDVLHGANKESNSVPLVDVISSRIAGTDAGRMIYSVADISHLNQGYGLKIDGLLGYPFLSRGKTSINFVNRKIYLWPADAQIAPR